MKKNERGFAFILVLILLAIGATIMIPMLQFLFTASKGSQIVTQNQKSLYAAEGGLEFVAWGLKYGGLLSQLQEPGVPVHISVDVCDIPVDIVVVMRAVPGAGPVTLATGDVIQPTKTVTASNPVSSETPDHVANDSYQTFTYIIRLEQLSGDTSQGLDAIYDILSDEFPTGTYVLGSSYIRTGGGEWTSIANPLKETYAGRDRLRWPASGNFPSPIRDFTPRQVKELKYQVALSLPSSAKNQVLCNWVVLKPWDTLSGPVAQITVGSPTNPDIWLDAQGYVEIHKTSDPELILAGVESDVSYTITITNHNGYTVNIEWLADFLPPEFYYVDDTSGGTFPDNPNTSIEEINGVDRQVLLWEPQGSNPAIAAGATLTQTFQARTTQEVSGTYFNEVQLGRSDQPNVPSIFSTIGITQTEFYGSYYSWLGGAVTVPTYDASANTTDTTIDANMGRTPGGVDIYSWFVR